MDKEHEQRRLLENLTTAKLSVDSVSKSLLNADIWANSIQAEKIMCLYALTQTLQHEIETVLKEAGKKDGD